MENLALLHGDADEPISPASEAACLPIVDEHPMQPGTSAEAEEDSAVEGGAWTFQPANPKYGQRPIAFSAASASDQHKATASM